jgi:5'-nucleotidase
MVGSFEELGFSMTEEQKPLILVCNDDGVRSAGLAALAQSLASLGQVVVVAPDRERSAAGHALTLAHPLRATRVATDWYSVDGTPTDCVALAVMELLPRRPALVAAGINHGANLGDDVTYSGTVASALEATLQGVPAMAISVAGDGPYTFAAAAMAAARIAREVLRRGLPRDTLLNVNVPNLQPGDISGIAVTRQGRRIYSETVVRKVDPRGKTYYWIGGASPRWEPGEETDHEAVGRGLISVTPLHLDLTNHRVIETLRAWNLAMNGGSTPLPTDGSSGGDS